MSFSDTGVSLSSRLSVLLAIVLVGGVITTSTWVINKKRSLAAEPYILRNDANVRDLPTTKGSRIVGMLEKGESVNVEAANEESTWMRISGGPFDGHFVWSRNLSAATSANKLEKGVSSENVADKTPDPTEMTGDFIEAHTFCMISVVAFTARLRGIYDLDTLEGATDRIIKARAEYPNSNLLSGETQSRVIGESISRLRIDQRIPSRSEVSNACYEALAREEPVNTANDGIRFGWLSKEGIGCGEDRNVMFDVKNGVIVLPEKDNGDVDVEKIYKAQAMCSSKMVR